MKVLWLTNGALPEVSILMNEPPSPYGGWLINSSRDLADNLQGELAIAFPSTNAKQYTFLKGEKVCYYPFEPAKDNAALESILTAFKPDIVHIYGTEYSHTLAMINLCNSSNIQCVVSIQGLVSYYANYYMADVPNRVQNRFTFRDILKMDNLKLQRRKFRLRGEKEKKSLKNCKHVIGRTTWDKACALLINPDLEYHFCNETLRESFYKSEWKIDRCEKYSIFMSQASYPIKGAHYMLKALPSILKRFPETKLYIAGNNIIKHDTLFDKIKISSYGKYIAELTKKYNLQNNVFFTGTLNEKQMCRKYIESNVFVCPSSIENSPNSLGEAMILGVPCVSSKVGGVSDMIKGDEEGFVYQSNAPEMLSYYVCKVFEDEELAKQFSDRSKLRAKATHNRDINTQTLLDIYSSILNR